MPTIYTLDLTNTLLVNGKDFYVPAAPQNE
jgi:hypothetical protein